MANTKQNAPLLWFSAPSFLYFLFFPFIDLGVCPVCCVCGVGRGGDANKVIQSNQRIGERGS